MIKPIVINITVNELIFDCSDKYANSDELSEITIYIETITSV